VFVLSELRMWLALLVCEQGSEC